jgi:C1A family cysteine protease
MRLSLVAIVALGGVLLALGAFRIHQSMRVKHSVNEKVPAHIQAAFSKWKTAQKRLYASPQENEFRLKNFYSNFLKIQEISKMKISFTMELNMFADLSEEEYRNKYLTLKEPKEPSRLKSAADLLAQHKAELKDDIPDWVDWRARGAVNEVVAQHECGSCWAFVGIVAVEGAWKISGRNLEKFAEQQLVDCAAWTGAEGCSGGWMEHVYEHILKVGGVMRSSDYPYKATVQDCKEDKSKFVGKLKDWLSIPSGDCKNLLLAITYSTIATAIDAGYMPFYKSGVYDYPHCSDSINHAVSIVGYGTDWGNGKPYWLVRNTFGPEWGEEGYIRMDRTIQPNSGICGLCKRASFALAADK